MATVKERVAYLRGLMQGSGIGQNPNEQQVWNELLGIMEQIMMEQLESGTKELGASIWMPWMRIQNWKTTSTSWKTTS